MNVIEKLLKENPELVRIQDDLLEWQKDYEKLLLERDQLREELDHLRIVLASDAP
ncbi:MAG: hypothetical protein O3C57_03685 [Verrucomicrobia bacterium]|nr:hypothetical protein [Verrucomicrobiota bacterium]